MSVTFPNYLSEMDEEEINIIEKGQGLQGGLADPATREIAQGLIAQQACACVACCSIAMNMARIALAKVGTNG